MKKRNRCVTRSEEHPVLGVILALVLAAVVSAGDARQSRSSSFRVEEATIAHIQEALTGRRITTVGVVEQYLARIRAYNGPCVREPQGMLGVIATIPRARQINALATLNLRPTARNTWNFDARKTRNLTNPKNDNSNMPDALEVTTAQDRHLQQTNRLVNPLHSIVMAIKDQYDTFDLQTTSNTDTQYANDRPPDDATIVKQLKNANTIILTKTNITEYTVDGAQSSFSGTFCNPYDTEREPNMSNANSTTSITANLMTYTITEETVVSIR